MEDSASQPEPQPQANRPRVGTSYYAAPLICLGMACVAIGLFRMPDPSGSVAMVLAGVFYLLSGVLLYTSWQGAPKLAMIAWGPLFLAIPVGTLVALLAFRGLRKWNQPPAPVGMQLGRDRSLQLGAAVDAFVTEFGAYEDASGTPLSVSRDLHIPPGTFARFLDDLRIDHGLSIWGADATEVDSLQELLELLSSRHSVSGRSN